MFSHYLWITPRIYGINLYHIQLYAEYRYMKLWTLCYSEIYQTTTICKSFEYQFFFSFVDCRFCFPCFLPSHFVTGCCCCCYGCWCWLYFIALRHRASRCARCRRFSYSLGFSVWRRRYATIISRLIVRCSLLRFSNYDHHQRCNTTARHIENLWHQYAIYYQISDQLCDNMSFQSLQ